MYILETTVKAPCWGWACGRVDIASSAQHSITATETESDFSPVVVGWLGGCKGQGDLSLAWVLGPRGGYASPRVAETKNRAVSLSKKQR